MKHTLLSLNLAKADLLNEWPLSLAIIGAIAALLFPVLTLQGIKEGIVDGMLEELNADPASRELQPIGQGHFDKQFFTRLEALEGVLYLIPATRYLAAPITLAVSTEGNKKQVSTFMIPTSEGDPLLPLGAPAPSGKNSIVLTTALAEELSVTKGDKLIGTISRRSDEGDYESIKFNFDVIEILPPSSRGDKAALLSRDFVYASEFYREHITSTFFEQKGKRTIVEEQRIFPSFRLYVEAIDYVEPVRAWLAQQNVRTVTQIDRINLVRRLDNMFSNAVRLLLITGGSGLVGALACTFWLNIKRKRRELSMLLAVGFTPLYLNLISQIQAVVLALTGAVVASITYAISIKAINDNFEQRFGVVHVTADFHFFSICVITGTTLLVAMVAAQIASMQILSIEPGEGLRDE